MRLLGLLLALLAATQASLAQDNPAAEAEAMAEQLPSLGPSRENAPLGSPGGPADPATRDAPEQEDPVKAVMELAPKSATLPKAEGSNLRNTEPAKVTPTAENSWSSANGRVHASYYNTLPRRVVREENRLPPVQRTHKTVLPKPEVPGPLQHLPPGGRTPLDTAPFDTREWKVRYVENQSPACHYCHLAVEMTPSTSPLFCHAQGVLAPQCVAAVHAVRLSYVAWLHMYAQSAGSPTPPLQEFHKAKFNVCYHICGHQVVEHR